MQLSRQKLALAFLWPSTNKIKGTQHHHKLILHSSCHIQRILVVATEVEQVTIRVGNERLLVITSALISSIVTQRATICHHRWYMFLLHWIIKSSIHPSCPQFINRRPALHRTFLVITGALTEMTVTQREMSCHHWWYLCLIYWMILSLIQLICSRSVNSHPDLQITQHMSYKLL